MTSLVSTGLPLKVQVLVQDTNFIYFLCSRHRTKPIIFPTDAYIVYLAWRTKLYYFYINILLCCSAVIDFNFLNFISIIPGFPIPCFKDSLILGRRRGWDWLWGSTILPVL